MDYKIVTEEQCYECGVCLQKYRSKKILRKHIKDLNHKVCNDIPIFLKAFLPNNYRFNTLSFKKYGENSFMSKIVLPDVSDITSVHTWVEEFSKLNDCIYSRRLVGKQFKSPKMMMRELYLCYHYGPDKGKGRKKKLKGTNCRSKITVALKKGTRNFAAVTIKYDHNHPLGTMKQRINNPFINLKEIFIPMFENGATASEALKNYTIHVETQILNGITDLQNPCHHKLQDYDWVRHLFQRTYEQKYKNTKSIELSANIKTYIAEINKHHDDPICCFKEIANDFVILITTPMMKRVSETEQIHELFIDAIGNASVFGLKVFLLMIQVEDIALPFGVVISSSDSSDVISQGFQLCSNFNEESKKIPPVVITDTETEKLKTLESVFPNTKQLICPIHFLKICHRWLIKNQITTNDRNKIFDKFHEIVYAKDETIFKSCFDDLKNCGLEKKVLKFMENMYKAKEKWALCYRNGCPVKDTSRVCLEHDIRLLKDQILDQIKMQSLKSLIDFIAYDFSEIFFNIFTDRCLQKNTENIRSC